ncbi:aliphatic sulfonate ABC transporter substrate-binding protein [Salinibacterium hongtaonis]|uniref:Putative aliphatic sulfonates-binding protein n=1 Tax=Homoserinimonas hongtaonis TaxID=2079791 RepID=A0A2U1SYQ2_9MICO|nr:aliphatic sulfonate ABC transporter substrate-binding protein [Salinibacterium hongtaonis]AWB89283.1 aliphatic sulfonates ABC transporter substrate-binding protein [Salinibacterium hongtaonis]PWB96732.1 aliphatic sulfonate ABC transporter substrate-binding protein [Salinibacterium hongtaonis]
MRLAPTLSAVALAAASVLVLSGCVAGEGSAINAEPTAEDWSTSTLNIDFATYNPLSLIIKEQGWLEEELDGVTVNWLQSAGSNKANEALRAGAVDVGSTAGSAALLARSNGSPIQVISIYSQPEWAAIVVPDGSAISDVTDLRGKKIAATKGTDPYFFLLQALEEAGVGLDEVTIENLQHADGAAALAAGAVDAWSGLDPIMATSEVQSNTKLIYRNIDFNTYGFLNATEDFITNHADVAQVVVNAYEKAREWATANPDDAAAILAEVAGIDVAIAEKVLIERTNFDVGAPGKRQRDVLAIVGPIFVESGDVTSQDTIDAALDSIFNDTFFAKADASAIGN